MKILIIEDEIALSESISAYLNSEHFTCEMASHFNTAMEKISLYDYACVILDITLPGGSGMDLLRELKMKNKTDGILIISARNALDEKFWVSKQAPTTTLPNPFICQNSQPAFQPSYAANPLMAGTFFVSMNCNWICWRKR